MFYTLIKHRFLTNQSARAGSYLYFKLQLVGLKKHLFSKWLPCGKSSKYENPQSNHVPPHECWGTFSALVS